jgi:hypothetical protein
MPKKSAAKKNTPAAATMAAEAPTLAQPPAVGDVVHYHAPKDKAPTADSAMPATVLHVADKARGRVDLLAHDKSGNPLTVRDAMYSDKRTPDTWTNRATE